MIKLNEELKEEMPGCDYYSTKDLKANGICYVFYQYQVDEILKYIKTEVVVKNNDCGFTLNIPRKHRKEVY